jgi:hypothetical protein
MLRTRSLCCALAAKQAIADARTIGFDCVEQFPVPQALGHRQALSWLKLPPAQLEADYTRRTLLSHLISRCMS